MYKVQLFEGSILDVLQRSVNEWMAEHRDITIFKAALNTVAENYHTFFILYTTANAQEEELKELAAEVQPEQSVEAAVINPEVLKPTS